MTGNELIAVLEGECQTTKLKVEDFLNALGDTMVDELTSGREIRLGKIGIFRLRRRADGNLMLNFYASEQMRKRLNIAASKLGGEACPECEKRANKARRQKRWAPKRKR